jgi:tRNA wybutosine-synthesizing protein 1
LTWEAESNQKPSLRNVQFAVFGLGNSVYQKYFNVVARTLDKCLFVLGATRVHRLGLGDEQTNVLAQFDSWCAAAIAKMAAVLGAHVTRRVVQAAAAAAAAAGAGGGAGAGAGGKAKAVIPVVSAVDDPPVDDDDDDESGSESGGGGGGSAAGEPVGDVEDMGGALNGEVDAQTTEQLLAVPNDERREMLSDLQRRTLTKQGYQIIGSHSAVKMCRWTKAQLRGRGGCYKHTFYGITSYQCMEMTPSMACANKCVFCWRHHKNPVGRAFVWKVLT